MLHSKIKNLLNEKVPNITNFLKDMGLPLSYLGVRYFLSGKQEKMGEKGLEKIISKLGYEMILVPVKKDSSIDRDRAIELQDIFIDDFNNYLDKFQDDKKTSRRSNEPKEPLSIEGILSDLDTSKPNSSDGIGIDLGINTDDLF